MQRVRRFLAPLLVLVLLPVLALASPQEDPILEIEGTSLEGVQYATAAVQQDVQPIVLQRGALVDGHVRGRTFLPMTINGSPFRAVWQAPTVSGVRLETGTYDVSDVDLSLPAVGFPWVVGRTYNNRQDDGGHVDSDGPQGKNWFQVSQPEIVLYDDATEAANDIVYLFYGADRFAEYKRASNSATTFRSRNGSAGVFEHTAAAGGEPEIYTLTDQAGMEFHFFGFDEDASPAEGQLWKVVDPDGNVAFAGHATTASTAISSGYTATGRMEYLYDTSDRRWTYAYDGNDRISSVKAETKTGGTWGSPTGVTEVGKVEYSYYGAESYGDDGDLKMVEITTPLTDSGVSLTRKKYYRYWEGTYNATTNPGHPHDIKYIVDFEGTRQQDWQDSTFDEDFLTETDGNLESYASAYFEYDSSYRIVSAWFNGECGCSGAANGTFNFEYETNGSFSDTSETYDEEWKERTVVARPDGSYLTQYFDEVGQALSRVITDADPDNTSPVPDRWVTEVERNSNGMVAAIYTPANVTGYTHSTGAITNSTSAGLVWAYTRSGSGARLGTITAVQYKEGTSGTAYYEREYAYAHVSKSINSGESYVYRPTYTDVHDYHVLGSTVTTDRVTTSPSSSAYSSDVNWESVTTTHPTVSTSTNGSGSATTETQYFREDGTRFFYEAEDGVITYWEYTGGRLTEMIEDVDTTQTGDFDTTKPSGLTSDAGAVHRTTTYTYDAQGRPDTVTQPDGRVFKTYYSKLADGRMVTLRYNDYDSGTPTFYGPVSYTVSNHAGKAEVQATVALSGNSSTTALTGHVDETDADPITGMDLGTVCRLTTNHYNETGGTLEESRLYFSIPSSEPGTDGTHYDPTFYGYDDSGQRTRVKEATGTIRRMVYDIHGRVTERWLGTNDNSFSGGEPTGTDDMVKVEELVYDSGADDGNGLLTKRTQYVQDSATDKRETTYQHHFKGYMLVETRPTAPHALHKVDNMGRRTFTGLYSSATGLDPTDDPDSLATNRIGLSSTEYDALGRAWRTSRYEVDSSDGSEDDSLNSDTWYDEVGRVIKRDGEQLAKTVYDRLGRQTHSFILAVDNDTVYANADDVSGDIVLEEHQTVYESSDVDDVLMRVNIARLHDDYGGSETTGALDTNADTDELDVTAADLEGRPQITVFWYDRFGRVTDTVRYGTNGGSDLDIWTTSQISVPSRSDTELLTENTYNDDGEVEKVTDPRNLVAYFEYDAAGRRTKEVRNYDASVNSGNPSGTDDNQTVVYEYTNGLRTKITADLPSGSTDQETLYIYGTTNATPSASEISTGHLLRAVVYPDSTNTGTTEANINSDDSDVVSFAYNALGEQVYKKDQAGNVFQFDYDDSGRREAQRVTTVASGFDDAVERISTTYTSLGQVDLVSSYDDPSAGSVVNQVDYTYDGWGNVTSFKQDKNSAIGGSGYYEVAYGYAKATNGRNTLKRTSATLPSGNVITYAFQDASGLHDLDASRVTEVKDGAVVLAQYAYNGVGQVVGIDHAQPDIMWEMYGSTSGSYPDLDRFNRVTSSRWTTDLATDVDFYDVDIAYDRNSNITLAEDNVHVGFDVSYTMDDLDRVIDAQEGTWNGSSITSETRQQEWTLDHVGNWDVGKLDLNGDGDWSDTDEYNDDRTHNDVNELTARDTDDNGTNDFTLSYDAVGNLTDGGESYKYVYDPFGRLRKVNNQSSALVAEYKYNGLGHMIAVHEDNDTDGDVDANDKWFYPVHDERWRMVANFREDDTAPKEEWVPHQAGAGGYGVSSYINSVICREKDANSAWTSASDGTLEQRIYYCQDWRGDVSALVTSGGLLAEWAKYESYGIPFGLPGGDTDSDGDCDSADVTQIQSWIDAPAYNVRGDIDLDGDVDATDKETAANLFQGTVGGRSSLSSVGNRRGFAGYEETTSRDQWNARLRNLSGVRGAWNERDPLVYPNGMSMYEYAGSSPLKMVDPTGAIPCLGEGSFTAPVSAEPSSWWLAPLWDFQLATSLTSVCSIECEIEVTGGCGDECGAELHCFPKGLCSLGFDVGIPGGGSLTIGASITWVEWEPNPYSGPCGVTPFTTGMTRCCADFRVTTQMIQTGGTGKTTDTKKTFCVSPGDDFQCCCPGRDYQDDISILPQ